MPITLVIDLYLKPESVDGQLQTLKELLPGTRAFEGCLSVNVVRDEDKPGHVALIERWEHRDDQLRYLGWRQETGAMDDLAAASAAPPTFTYFSELPEI